jgi:sulfur carrier protein
MKLTVNGQSLDVRAATLDRLLDELAYEGPWLATAVNQNVIHAAERVRCALEEGDRIEILSPMQGG